MPVAASPAHAGRPPAQAEQSGQNLRRFFRVFETSSVCHTPLEGVVGAVTKRLVIGLLAATEIDRLRRLGFKHDRLEIRPLVGTVTEWLFLALATHAPPVFAARNDVHCNRFFLGDHRVGHHFSP